MRRALFVLLLLAQTPSARAEPPAPRLSDHGRQILDGALGGSWSNEREPGVFERSPRYSVFVQPSWLYFVRDGIGIGGYAGYQLTRASSGLDNPTGRQSRSGVTDQSDLIRPPPMHDVDLGLTAAFELFVDGRLSLFARPYFGLSLHVGKRLGETFHELRPRAGLRLPLVYQLSGSIGLGFGPDLAWENVSGFQALRLGASSWLVRSF